MQKETLIAIFIGLSLGLLMTFAIYQYRQTKQEKKIIETEETITENHISPTPVNENMLTFEIPVDGLVTTKDKLETKGQFKTKGYLVESINDQIKISQLSQHNFSFTLPLKIGPNIAYLVGLDSDGKIYGNKRLIVRQPIIATTPEATTGAKLADHLSVDASGESKLATTAAILQRINKKLAQKKLAQIKKRAILGQIKRVTEESVSLENDQGTFILAIGPDVKLIKLKKSIKINQLVVGDWALVIGEVEQKETTLPVVTPSSKFKPLSMTIYHQLPIAEKPMVMIGSIQKIRGNQLTIKNRADNEIKTVRLDKQSIIRDIKNDRLKSRNLETDFNAIVVAKNNKEKQLIVKRLKVLVDIHQEKP